MGWATARKVCALSAAFDGAGTRKHRSTDQVIDAQTCPCYSSNISSSRLAGIVKLHAMSWKLWRTCTCLAVPGSCTSNHKLRAQTGLAVDTLPGHSCDALMLNLCQTGRKQSLRSLEEAVPQRRLRLTPRPSFSRPCRGIEAALSQSVRLRFSCKAGFAKLNSLPEQRVKQKPLQELPVHHVHLFVLQFQQLATMLTWNCAQTVPKGSHDLCHPGLYECKEDRREPE